MNPLDQAFIADEGSLPPMPLGRYLPPLPAGVISAWLRANVAPGSWVLDPIGAHPQLALEAARAGYRVLVASNNPVLSFLTEILAAAPPRDEFESALAALASSKRGEERLERHIQSLYLTPCAACGRSVPAQAFIWQREPLQLIARIYRCANCGDEGERPATSHDLERLALPGSDALHRSRALLRVVTDQAPQQKELVEEALKTYLPRPLYVLTTLINKCDALPLAAERRKLLTALLIQVCDEANTLWQHPSARPRPRQLTIPALFRENNLWLALENALSFWDQDSAPVPLSIYPQPPGGAGICLLRGRAKALLPLSQAIQPAALISVLPRPNQAFWTLCALWSGWLWGRDAVQSLRGALERRRYDWYWMAQAVSRVLSGLRRELTVSTPFFALVPETIPGFLLSAFSAPPTAGFDLRGFALDSESELAQFTWQTAASQASAAAVNPKQLIEQAIIHHLEERGEPARYQPLYAAALTALKRNGLLPGQINALNSDLLTRTQAILADVLDERSRFARFAARQQSEEGGFWWLAQPSAGIAPLADRVEKEIVALLEQTEAIRLNQLKQALYSRFPGLLTPPTDLIRAVLESYAQPVSGLTDAWQLRAEDAAAHRRADLDHARSGLENLARKLGYTLSGGEALTWHNPDGSPAYQFHFLVSSNISRVIFQPQPLPPRSCILVLPGGRTALLGFKLRRDPHLRAVFEQGWRLLKFRHLRQLTARPVLSPALWEELLDGDPPHWDEAVQMSMF
ncbi:MAG: hypothetical protein AB1453_14195 [Chloroflexota bacterium]|jgi:hypothetical protein